MIIKGKGRGRARQLAAHLLRSDQNERIRVFECRGTIADDPEGALTEMEAHAAAVNTARPLYHASISPEAKTPLTDPQIRIAVDTLERKLGLQSQPRLVVVHRKAAREHIHVVWSRIDMVKRRVISDAWNYRWHEEAARALEARFGHDPVEGSLAQWHRSPRATRTLPDRAYRQQERSGQLTLDVTTELTSLWQASPDGEAFRKKLDEAGYILARGDRRVFVVIDRHGEVHSLARRIAGAATHDVRVRLASIPLHSLPSVAEAWTAKPAVRPKRKIVPAFAAAAQEVTWPARRRRASRGTTSPMVRTVTDFPTAVMGLTQPVARDAASAPTKTIASRAAVRLPDHYRGKRAIIVADFAAKIAAAIRDAPRHELDAILAALRMQRDDALLALSGEHRVGWGGRRQSRDRRRKKSEVRPRTRKAQFRRRS